MALARVVTFDGVDSDRIAQMQREMEGSERPDNVPASEIIILHDPRRTSRSRSSSSRTRTTTGSGTKRSAPCRRGKLPASAPPLRSTRWQSAWRTSG